MTTARERELARERRRRFRRREREGSILVKVELPWSIVDRLIADEFLQEWELSDPQSIDRAVEQLLRLYDLVDQI